MGLGVLMDVVGYFALSPILQARLSANRDWRVANPHKRQSGNGLTLTSHWLNAFVTMCNVIRGIRTYWIRRSSVKHHVIQFTNCGIYSKLTINDFEISRMHWATDSSIYGSNDYQFIHNNTMYLWKNEAIYFIAISSYSLYPIFTGKINTCHRLSMTVIYHGIFLLIIGLWDGNPSVSAGVPHNEPIMQRFDVLSAVSLLKPLNEQWSGWWSLVLWNSCDVTVMLCHASAH